MTISYSFTNLNVSAWQAISAVDVAFYGLFLLLIIYPLIKTARLAFKRFMRIILLNLLVMLAKLSGGAVLLYLVCNFMTVSSSTQINMVIASSVLVNIAAGLVLTNNLRMIEYINHFARNKPDQNIGLLTAVKILIANVPGTRLEAIEAIYWRIVLVTVILSSAGSGTAYNNFDTAKALSRAGSILFVIELAVLYILIANAFRMIFTGDKANKKYVKLILGLTAIDTVFLTVRIAATVASAFSMTKTSQGFPQSKYSFLFGSWDWYSFLSFMPECIAVGIWVVIMWCLAKHLTEESARKYEEMDESSQKISGESV